MRANGAFLGLLLTDSEVHVGAKAAERMRVSMQRLGIVMAHSSAMKDDAEPALNAPRMPCHDCGTALDPERYIVLRVSADTEAVSLCRRCWVDRKAGKPYRPTD